MLNGIDPIFSFKCSPSNCLLQMFARLPKQFLDSPCCAPHIVGAAPEEGHLVAVGGGQQSKPLSSFSRFAFLFFLCSSYWGPLSLSLPYALGLRLSRLETYFSKQALLQLSLWATHCLCLLSFISHCSVNHLKQKRLIEILKLHHNRAV